MNIDDLKSSYQSLSFGGGERHGIDFTRKVEDAVERVRKEDHNDKTRIIGVSILLAGFALAYGGIGLLKYFENTDETDYYGYALYVLALISFVPVLIMEYRRIKHVNYDVSVIEFIANVEKRFALFRVRDLWIIPGILIIDASLVFMISKSGYPTFKTILIAQIILVFSIMVGLIVRLIIWRKKMYLVEELRRIKQSLN